MRPKSSYAFDDVISIPRLKSYKRYFKISSNDKAIGLYMWNCELSVCFTALLSFFEIILRNKVHRALSQHYSHGNSNSFHWYDKMKIRNVTRDKVEELRYKNFRSKKRKLREPKPTPDEVVSRVTFGFWTSVLGSIEKQSAKQILPEIFPFHSLSVNPTAWMVDADRNSALAFIRELNRFRNRIAHHEPLWKFSEVPDTSPTVPASKNIAESLARFNRLLGLLDAAIKAMDKNFYMDFMQSSWRRKLDFLLSTRGISRYTALKHCPDKHSLTKTKFCQQFQNIVKKNKPVRVEYFNRKGLFIPE